MKPIYFGIFLIALTTLMLELLFIRVFDVILYKNMAYLVITCALFSFGIAGVYSTLKPLNENTDIKKRLSKLSILFGITALLTYPIINWLPFDFEKFSFEPFNQLLYFLGLYISLASPFFFSGLIFTTIFSLYSKKIQSLYFWDLIGAAFGCIIIIPFLPIIGPGGLLFMVCALCFLAAALFLNSKKIKMGLIGLAILLIIIPFLKEGYYSFRLHSNKRGVSNAQSEGRIEYSYWDPISKIDVIDKGNNKHVAYDGGSQSTNIYSFDGNLKNLRKNLPDSTKFHFWNRGVLASHYLLENTNQEVLIIGAAGGQEIKAALTYGASEVDGVEMVKAVVELGEGKYARYNGNIFNNPKVDVFVDEGRRFLSGTDEKYDIIQIFSNHTSSSIASGSGALETNYLQTAEAYEEYFSHLTNGGILHINHHIYPRIITTAALAWKNLGRTDFQNHVVVFERVDMRDNLPTILIKMTKWTSKELGKLKTFFKKKTPSGFVYKLVENPINTDKSFLNSEFYSGNFPDSLSDIVPYYVEPVTDDKPFFNFLREEIERLNVNEETFVNRSVAGLLNSQLTVRKSIPKDLMHLIITGIISLFSGFLFIVIPLKLSKVGKSKEWTNRTMTLTYFSCLGTGFILLELILVQIFMELIGNPLYSYSTVLFVLLFAAGLGSMVSHKLRLNEGSRWRLPFIGIFCIGVIILLIHQPVFDVFLSASLQIRILITAVLIFPLGFFLGMPFPLGILAISSKPTGAIAWAWGLNGLFTVIGGLLSVIFALLLGFKYTIFLALLIYLFSFFVLYKIKKREKFSI